MRIYHYTSIESLALILSNKTIRFTRLDKVDDPEEYAYEQDGHNPALFVYVSCWTKNACESIPQWVMYGNRRHGVRISFEGTPFSIKNDGGYTSLFDKAELTDKSFMTMPILGDTIKDIKYVVDPKEKVKEIFPTIGQDKAIDFNKVAIYKRVDWEFQKECRFIMSAFPKNQNGKMWSLPYYIEQYIYCKETFIDVPIEDSAFESMQIMVGPDTTLAEKIIVESLCKTYLGHKNVQQSKFTR